MRGHTRVIPRDLFNESKLLKGLGQLALKIHDNGAFGLTMHLFDEEDNGFLIYQDPGDGSLLVANLVVLDRDKEPVRFRSTYNSKEPYPLYMVVSGTEEEITVFNDDGSFTEEFTERMKQ